MLGSYQSLLRNGDNTGNTLSVSWLLYAVNGPPHGEGPGLKHLERLVPTCKQGRRYFEGQFGKLYS
jgi:hypothetical protein